MTKNILYAIAAILLLVSAFFIYGWYKSEPDNKEPLPALLSTIATIMLTIIAWRLEGTAKEGAGSGKTANESHIAGNNNIVNQGNSNSNIQIHTGTGDNIKGDKKVYNIDKIDKADFS
jgi:hypothetical protein